MHRTADYLEERKRGTISETCCEHVVPIVPLRREPLHAWMQMEHLAGHLMACLIRFAKAKTRPATITTTISMEDAPFGNANGS